MSESRRTKCASCEAELPWDHQGPCPACGKPGRVLSICVSDTVSVEKGFGTKVMDPSGFVKGWSRGRTKVSRKTKVRAHETMSFDRSHPEFTLKIHRVEEINEEGRPEVVHYEEVKYPAKRRPGKRKE